MKSKSFIEYFYQQEKSRPNAPFLHQPFGDKWETYSWKEVGQKARKMAAYLQTLGLGKGSKVALVSKNCREWVIADLAIIMAGCTSVPLFPTLSGEQIAHILTVVKIDLIFVGKTEHWESMKTGIPENIPMIRFPHYENNDLINRGLPWGEVMKNNQVLKHNFVPDKEDVWTIIFTSGTTGNPKGVVHKVKNVNAYIDYVLLNDEIVGDLNFSRNGGDRMMSYLPLNHIAERLQMVRGIVDAVEVFFVESIDKFLPNMQYAQPTHFLAVPRIWTKLKQGVLTNISEQKLNRLLKIPFVKNIVQRKVKKIMGLNKVVNSLSTAAPLSDVNKIFFAKLGLPISELYGMTEIFIHTYLDAKDKKPGSVGKGLVGEIKIDENTQEILVKSPYVTQGYYKDEAKTLETIRDGWMHTGDQGKLVDGYLYITGRVKDTFKTSKGEFITPAKIEDKFSDIIDIEQLCLLGLGMPKTIMIANLSEIGKAKDKNSLTKELEPLIKQINSNLAAYERMGALVIAKEDFSIENDLLTPTLKVKRNKVHHNYKDKLLGYCQQSELIIWE
jgi:long-subunit acyl-CoA synthetase (AMP-forming)